MGSDWRGNSSDMRSLISKFHNRAKTESTYTDTTFKLKDGSLVSCHKLILAIASPYFESRFYGLLAGEYEDTQAIQDVDSNAFRRVLDFIYDSEAQEWNMEAHEYWDLLHAANMYLIPGLDEHCTNKIKDFLKTINDLDELVVHVNKASQFEYSKEIYLSGIESIKDRIKTLVKQDTWGKVQRNVVFDILKDDKLKITEGDVFIAMIDWCKANTSSEEESVKVFQNQFAQHVMVKNISQDAFLNKIGKTNYLNPDLFKNWTFEVMKNNTEEATRHAKNHFKVIQTTITKKDFLEPRRVGLDGTASDFVVWKGESEYADVNIEVRIYQKISEGIHVPKGKFGILLETIHRAKAGLGRDVIKERVSVKMVAKKGDGTIVKKLFKPVEDSTRDEESNENDGRSRKTNIFVLSKNKDERLNWTEMEVVIIIDRRRTCDIKAISGEDYSISVCTASTHSYLDRAVPFQFDVSMSIADAVKNINKSMGIHQEVSPNILTQWLYIFTKGFVSNLRSRRALPNDYWTADTMEDFMRCKVINFPIGVLNETRRRDAFKTWVIANMASELKMKDKDKKTLFVVTYNPTSKEVKYVRNICVTVICGVETLGLMEHMNLGKVEVTDTFLNHVSFGMPEHPSKIFIRRVFPVQDESNPMVQKLAVTEIVKGQVITHVDDCHVIVIQENSPGLDYNEFIVQKIREIKVQIKPRSNHEGDHFEVTMDPDSRAIDVIDRMSELSMVPNTHISIYECFSSSHQITRAGEYPLDSLGEMKLGQMFDYCKDKPKTLFYEFNDILSPSDEVMSEICTKSEDMSEICTNSQ